MLLVQDITAGQDDEEISELLDNMSPTQPWAEPPPNPPLAPDADPIAAGEESVARHEEAQRIQTVSAYPTDQLPQDPLEPAFLEPEPAADYVIAVVQLLTPREITDQAAQQQQSGQLPGFQPNLDATSVSAQGLGGQVQQGMPVPHHQAAPPQQPQVTGQYPPVLQQGLTAPYPSLQPSGFGVRPPGGPPPFRPPHGLLPAGPPQHQGPAIMRPLQVSNLTDISTSALLYSITVFTCSRDRMSVAARHALIQICILKGGGQAGTNHILTPAKRQF